MLHHLNAKEMELSKENKQSNPTFVGDDINIGTDTVPFFAQRPKDIIDSKGIILIRKVMMD